MADSLDSIVKGAPQPGQDVKSAPTGTSPIGSDKPGDPLNQTPSSPSMIYLNMLILEASLRAQYLELRARRRKHTFFLSLLCLWLAGFGYALFFAPREDGVGVGGSVYWVVDMTEKVCFISGIITGMLIWATGIWERGIRWPRRWFGISNRGLRGFNCKLVVVKRPWWLEVGSFLAWFFTYGAFSSTAGQYRAVEPSILRETERELNLHQLDHPHLSLVRGDEEKGSHEEDLAPGGDYVKLLLLPKPFSPNFRENWELYRSEFWERENERRVLISEKLKARERQMAKQQSPWFWWLPGGQRTAERMHGGGAPGEAEKFVHHRHSAILKESKRARSNSVRRGSTSSSRSPTPPVESEEGAIASRGAVGRRGSTASNGGEKRRKKHIPSNSRSTKRPGVEGRSLTPEIPSPLARESSVEPGAGDERAKTEP
ncbi:Nem1-Spo7 phosphatase regulatory subunit [Diatrype stigma]|uniref:Nem1-Spo7 phosphatase regulatory subunit n=1 Tax=Diatrype stigma TaxID=117547 RepID=A0AAN9UXN5_9PEZI